MTGAHLLVPVAILLICINLPTIQSEPCTICNPLEYGASVSPLWDLSQGSEMILEVATETGPIPHQGFLVQYFSDGNKKGTYIVTRSSDYQSIQYDMNAKVSHISSASEYTCDASSIEQPGTYTYRHIGSPTVVIPILESFFDFRTIGNKFISSSPTDTTYRGFEVKQYEACISENGFTFGVTYYLTEWATESGISPSPVGMDICTDIKGAVITASVTVSNFHNKLLAPAGSGGYHAIFTPPSEAFCPLTGSAQKPQLVQRYSFQGEYTVEDGKKTSPMMVAYDSKYDIINYHSVPMDTASGQWGFELAHIQDGLTGVKYKIDMINRTCQAYGSKDNSVVDFTSGAMAVVGPTRLNQVTLNKLNYNFVSLCRRMACDYFSMEESDAYYEYAFINDEWEEYNSGVSGHSHNVIASVSRYENGASAGVESVHIFDYTDDFSKLEQFDMVKVCYDASISQNWVRLYFKGDHNTLVAENNAYLTVAMHEAVADYSGISPLRVTDLSFDVFHDQLNFQFQMWGPHPENDGNPVSLEDALETLEETVKTGKFVVTVNEYPTLTADFNTFEICDYECNKVDISGIHLMYNDGYQMGMQISLHIPELPNLPILPFDTPFSTTYYIESYHGYPQGERGGRGSLYVYDRHTNFSVFYNEQDGESILIIDDDGSCKVAEMKIDYQKFPFGYMHDSYPIPLPHIIGDMGRWVGHNVRQRGVDWIHGFKTVVYEAETEVSQIGPINLPQLGIDHIPARVHWGWLDKDFYSEDGTFKDSGYVPAHISVTATIPDGPGFGPFAGEEATVYISVINYHNHYPVSSSTLDTQSDPLKLLIEVPAGIYCKDRIRSNETLSNIPGLPSMPIRFKAKSESIISVPYDYVITSEDYYDFNESLFRFDISQHDATKPGTNALTQITITGDTYYKIDRTSKVQGCETGSISDPPSDAFLDHALLAPQELLNLKNLNEQYGGIKPCRHMSCHYWIGQRTIEIDKWKGKMGTFEIWATTEKWETVQDMLDAKSTSFIKIALTIKDGDSILAREDVELYDMQLLTPSDKAELQIPAAEFCRGKGDTTKPEPIKMPKAYTYRGEYVSYDTKVVSTYHVMKDYEYDMDISDFAIDIFQYDSSPSAYTEEKPSYMSSMLLDGPANLIFDVDRMTNACIIIENSNDLAAAEWDLINPDKLDQFNGEYVGRYACRSKLCETFVESTPYNPTTGYSDFEVYFTPYYWGEVNSDNTLKIDNNVTARIATNMFDKDGEVIVSTHKSTDIFTFSTDVTSHFDFRWIASCFKDSDIRHLRLSITPANFENDEYFRSAVVRQLSYVIQVQPYRILNPKFKFYDDEIRLIFSLTDKASQDKVGISLDKAIQNLDSIQGMAIPIVMPSPGTGGQEVGEFTVEEYEACATGSCEIDAGRPIIYEFNGGTAFAVFFGCFIGGLLIITVILMFVFSSKLNTGYLEVFYQPSSSSASNPNPVSLSELSYR